MNAFIKFHKGLIFDHLLVCLLPSKLFLHALGCGKKLNQDFHVRPNSADSSVGEGPHPCDCR